MNLIDKTRTFVEKHTLAVLIPFIIVGTNLSNYLLTKYELKYENSNFVNQVIKDFEKYDWEMIGFYGVYKAAQERIDELNNTR